MADFPSRTLSFAENWRTIYSQPSEVLLKSCLVQLLVNTSVLGAKSIQDHWIEKYSLASFDLCSQGSSAKSYGIIPEGLDLGVLVGDLIITSYQPPTFTCLNIERTYGLDISVTIEYGGDVFDLSFEVCVVTVLAAEYAGGAWGERAKSEISWSHSRRPEIIVDDDFI